MLLVWGILLAGGAGAFTGGLIAANAADQTTYTPQLLGQALPLTPHLSPLAVFCSGLALGVVFCFGLWLIATAVRRHHARRVAQRRASPAPGTARQPTVLKAAPKIAAGGRAVTIAAQTTLRPAGRTAPTATLH